MEEKKLKFGNPNEVDPEECCYRDAVNELKKRNTVYIYREPVLKKVLKKFPNVKITRCEFYWRLENVENKLS